MKIRDLLTKTALCIGSLTLVIMASYLSSKTNEKSSIFSLSSLFTFNGVITVKYVFLHREKLFEGNEKAIFLGKRIDLLLAISQTCLGVILYLFYITFWGVITLSEIYIFITMMLYGNYYTLSPMPSESVSVFFEDEYVWRKVSKLRGRMMVCFGLIGFSAVLYFAPNELGIEYMYLYLTTMAISFITTYFYAKSQYFKKFNH